MGQHWNFSILQNAEDENNEWDLRFEKGFERRSQCKTVEGQFGLLIIFATS